MHFGAYQSDYLPKHAFLRVSIGLFSEIFWTKNAAT